MAKQTSEANIVLTGYDKCTMCENRKHALLSLAARIGFHYNDSFLLPNIFSNELHIV